MVKLLPFLVVCALLSVDAGGAFGTLWLLDMRDSPEFPGVELFRSEHPTYGRNQFAMIASHASQHWFESYAVYIEDPEAIGDPSDVYVRRYRGERTLHFIGYFTFMLIMGKLLPMFMSRLIPWHEMVVQSNDGKHEMGCRVCVRSYLEPMVWWLRQGSELSIRAGTEMFKNFKSIKLPRLHLGSEWNYASWHPYFAWGPAYFCYTPHKSLDYKTTMIRMAEEEDYMGKSDPIHFIEKKTMKRVFKAYQAVYVEGPWLTKADKLYLSRKRKAASAL